MEPLLAPGLRKGRFSFSWKIPESTWKVEGEQAALGWGAPWRALAVEDEEVWGQW